MKSEESLLQPPCDDEDGDLLDTINCQSSDGETSVVGGRAATTEDIENSLDSSHSSLDGRGSGPSSPRVVAGVTRGSAPSTPRVVAGATRGSAPSSPRAVVGVTRGSAPSSPRAGVARGSAPSPWAGLARGSAPQGWCPGCQKVWQKVWQKVRHMRWPLKDKLLDHDPSSLTCDQWVLKKRWRPRGRRALKSKLKDSLKLLHRRHGDIVRVQPTCSRAHTFLRRNLRLCAKPSARRGRKRKGAWRTSGKRPRSEPRHPEPPARRAQQPPALSPADRSHGDSDPSTLDSWSEEEQQGPAHVTLEGVPSLVTMETAEEARRPAKKGGFKDLLSQLRGKSRTIVKEDGQ
ncbi:hypothetical protein CRUP_015874 [Coryphaenoides rupestris]|nr:hypothetical protein CRUP_015874 [Coryphaenoides rupestris]